MVISYLTHFILILVIVFLVVFIATHSWIKRAKNAGLQGRDMHKLTETKVSEMGGITVLLGFIIGVMLYIATRIFVLNTTSQTIYILAILTAILIAAVIGIIDDILGWKIGLRQWQKPLLTLLVAAPIMAVNAGTKIMSIPFLGNIDLGILFPLIVIPAIILVGTNGFNMLAGFNGLEAGQGIIILSAWTYLTYISGSAWLSVISLCMVFALLGFLMYNHYPAKVFPGDTLTYTVGALIAIIPIFANLEKKFLIIFIPYIIQFFLKLRGGFQKESFAQVDKDNGCLLPRYYKTYGLENLMVKILNTLKIPATEIKVVYLIYGIQIIFVLAAFLI